MKWTPSLTLAEQDALSRFWQTPAGLRWFNGWRHQRDETGMPNYGESPSERTMMEARGLLGARTYFVSEEMVMLAEHAARSMPAQPFMQSDVPCPSGFLMMERPILTPDIHGKRCSLAAYRWERIVGRTDDGENMPGILWTLYSDLTDTRDDYHADFNDAAQSFPTKLALLAEDFEAFGRGEVPVAEIVEHFNAKEADVTEALFFMRRLPLAMWTLMQQRLAVNAEEMAHRTIRRQLGRLDSPLADQSIRVVRLRREYVPNENAEHGPVEWSHRWMVSGHWRNQWLPSVNAHRLQWIAPFVKGPADKPFAIKRTVHSLVR